MPRNLLTTSVLKYPKDNPFETYLNERDFYYTSNKQDFKKMGDVITAIKNNRGDVAIKPMGWFFMEKSPCEPNAASAYAKALFCGNDGQHRYKEHVLQNMQTRSDQCLQALGMSQIGSTPFDSQAKTKLKKIKQEMDKEQEEKNKKALEVTHDSLESRLDYAGWLLNANLMTVAQHVAFPSFFFQQLRATIQQSYEMWVHDLILQIRHNNLGQEAKSEWIPFWIDTAMHPSRNDHVIFKRNIFGQLNSRSQIEALQAELSAEFGSSPYNNELVHWHSGAAQQGHIYDKLVFAKIAECNATRHGNSCLHWLLPGPIAADKQAIKEHSPPFLTQFDNLEKKQKKKNGKGGSESGSQTSNNAAPSQPAGSISSRSTGSRRSSRRSARS